MGAKPTAPAAEQETPKIPDYSLMLLTVDNMMKIGAAEVKPGEPGLVPIIGKNGAGKTSLITSLAAALVGKDQLPKMPVRKGAKKGRVVVELGVAGTPALTIMYTMSQGSSDWSLTLKDSKGREIARPREVLDTLMQSKILCDPISLTSLEPEKQRQMLFQSQPDLAQEIAKLNAREASRADDAKDIRAQKKALEGSLSKLGDPPAQDIADKQPASSAEIAARIGKVRQLQEWQKEAARVLTGTQDLIVRAEQKREEMEKALAEQVDYIKTLREDEKRQSDTHLEHLNNLAAAEDIAALEAELSKVDATNAEITRAKTYYEQKGELTKVSRSLDKLDQERDTIADKKKALLAKIDLPVEGLTYDEEMGLLYTGVPIAQASMAQKIRIGVAMGIAMSPHVKLFLIRELGSLLDEDNKQLLHELCAQNGFHALIECVQGDRGILVEDGYTPGLRPEESNGDLRDEEEAPTEDE